MDIPRDEQKAKVLAFLLLSEINGNRCTPEDLSCACLAFSVSAEEIRNLCKLPNVPLRLLDNDRLIEVTKRFHIRFTSLLSLLHNQANDVATVLENSVVPPPKDDCVVSMLGSTWEPNATRSEFEGVNAIQVAVRDIRTQVEISNVFFPTGNGPTTNGSVRHDQNEKPSNYPPPSEYHLSAVHAGNPSSPLQRIVDTGNVCYPLEQAEKDLAIPQVKCPSKHLQRPENIPLGAAEACLAEQGLTLVNEIGAQPKKKSRSSRLVPRFDDYSVDGEVGAGGYGTVYKVRRLADGEVFAMKCPLENTHDSNVRNEINMLKRLRGKDYIIQFQREVIGKVSLNSDSGGGEDVNCPSILLDFVDHDKPEILKKEITIDELKYYSFSLFKALAHLHRERILHLDVKPGNFLFSRSTKRGCLVDFNLARDESAKRLTTRRPVRCSSRPSTAEAKTLDRRKCPKRSREEEEKIRTCVQPTKRSRKIFAYFPDLASPPATEPSTVDQSKQTLGTAANKDATVSSPKYKQLLQSPWNPTTGAIAAPVINAENNTLIAQQLEASKSLQKFRIGGSHRLAKFVNGGSISKASRPSTPSGPQTPGVSAIKPNPNKRVPARLPPPLKAVLASSAKRVKSAQKAPGHHVKDGPCVGTKGYRAPEVLMRSTRQTTKVDIWSAGVSLLQLITGRSPFPSTSTEGAVKDIAKLRGSVALDNLAKSLGQRHRFSKEQPYPGVSVKEWSDKHSRRTDLKGKIPSTLYDLIEKCLDVNPDSRITAEAALLHQFCSIDETAEVSRRHSLSDL